MIALGSTNEAKKEALDRAAEKLFDDNETVSVEVEGAPDQPVGLEDARQGALLRAREAREKTGAEIGVGIEGYIQEVNGDYYLSCFAAIVDGEKEGFGTSGLTRLTSEMQQKLPEKELGEVIVDVIGDDLREGKGAVGVLTQDRIGRPGFSYRSLVHAYSDFDR